MSLEQHYQEVRERLTNGNGHAVPDTPISLRRDDKQITLGGLQRQIETILKRLQVIEVLLAPAEYPLGPCHRIIEFICKQENVTKTELLGRRRERRIIILRHMGFYLCCKMTSQSLPQIGLAWGGFDHTTVMNGRDQLLKTMAKDKALFKLVAWYENALG